MDFLTPELTALISLAAVTGIIHTLAGPDHYIPFVMMSRSRQWSWIRTAVITLVCGVGHVMGSVVLGSIGIAAGVAISSMSSLESTRGTLAAWLMIAFGLLYAAWGIRRVMRNKAHTHKHFHQDGSLHVHEHVHEGKHLHVHDSYGQVHDSHAQASQAQKHQGEAETPRKKSITPWVLFTIFLFGPCEVLIPQLMVPAANQSLFGLLLVTTVFAVATIGTMLAMVLGLSFGFKAARLGWLERHTHALAGFSVALCGVLILVGF